MRHRPLSSTGATVGAFLLIAAASVAAQDASLDKFPGLRERAVVMDIVARVVEREAEESWTSENSKITIPGRAVSLKLVGKNVVVVVQFTPYRRDDGKQVLVAQGQVWVDTPEEGIRYQTTMQTIPMDYGERVFFFPLGPRAKDGHARIEIQVELRPYVEEAAAGSEEASRGGEKRP